MGTVADKLQATLESKIAIKQALTNQGLSPTDVLSTYAGLIDSLNQGDFAWEKCIPEGFRETNTLPYNFYKGATVIFDGEIHILGGNANSTKHYKWNGTQWVSVSTIPFKFSSSRAVVYNGEIHLIGSGIVDNHQYHSKWNGSTWESVSTLPYNFFRGAVLVYNGEIHILGYIGAAASHYKWTGTQWVSVSTLPYEFFAGSAVVLNGEIHIMGGENDSTAHYKWDGSTWESVSTLPFNFEYGDAVTIANEIHILGGSVDGTSHYKWTGSEWKAVRTLPYTFSEGSAVVLNGVIHIMGGTEGKTLHYNWEEAIPVKYIVSEIEDKYADGEIIDGYQYNRIYSDGETVYMLTTESGDTAYAQLTTSEQVALTATANDIRLGTTAVTETGVTYGEKDIPQYHMRTGVRLILANAEFTIPMSDNNLYDYSGLQAMTMPFNSSMDASVAVDRAVINDKVYNAGSTTVVANVTKDDANKAISLGITNGDTPAVIRYFTYKEEA